MKLKYKIILLVTLGVFLFCILFYLVVIFKDYYQWRGAKIAIASGGICDMYCTAAKITKVSKCLLDSDQVGYLYTRCGNSCKDVSNDLLSLCVLYNQIDINVLSGNKQKQYIAVPKVFTWKGGGSEPQANMQMIAGGMSNVLIEVGAIPKSAAVNTIQNTLDRFNFFIAGFKK